VREAFGTEVGLAALAAGRAAGAASTAVELAAAIGEAHHSETVLLPADRPRFRDFAVIGVLDLLRKRLSSPPRASG
jgi:hypothetical protein